MFFELNFDIFGVQFIERNLLAPKLISVWAVKPHQSNIYGLT